MFLWIIVPWVDYFTGAPRLFLIWSELYPLTTFLLPLWIVSEGLFYVYFRHHTRFTQWQNPAPTNNAKIRRFMLENMIHAWKMMTPGDPNSWRHVLSGWFYGRDVREIKRGNLISYFAASLFYTYPNRLSPDQREELEGYINRVEEAWQWTFPQGFNSQAQCMRINLDPVRPNHRPLSVYITIAAANAFSRLILLYLGFQRCSLGGFNYWFRVGEIDPVPSPPASPRPRTSSFPHRPLSGFDNLLRFGKPSSPKDSETPKDSAFSTSLYCLPDHLKGTNAPFDNSEAFRPKGLPIVLFHGALFINSVNYY